MHFPTDRTADTTTFDGPVVDHWLEQKIAQAARIHVKSGRYAMRCSEVPHTQAGVGMLIESMSLHRLMGMARIWVRIPL